MNRAFWPGLFVFLFAASPVRATKFDVSAEYRLRGLDYKNLFLGVPGNDKAFLEQSARLSFALKDIPLTDIRGIPETMDIVMKLRALGVTGSTNPLAAPFDRIAAAYPSADFTPFFEHSYLKLHNLGGKNWDLRIGRQPFSLGSGLLLDDNGAGLTGLSARIALPFWDMKLESFAFQANTRNAQFGAGNLDLYGFSLELPTEGTWQLNSMIEQDKTQQFVASAGCRTLSANGCLVGRTRRWFTSVRYQLSYGPMIFDGEAAIQRGAANPTGPNPAGTHVTFKGNAQYIRAKWRQTFFYSKATGRRYRGIGRISLARGSGDDPDTPTTDEAFFPSNGKRYDGLTRAGLGDFFGATGYDAFGGKSTATISGLPRGASGITAVGIGLTPPSWKGIILDVDYYIFQTNRAIGPHRTLGNELDIKLHYDIRDRLQLKLSAAYFTSGAALNVDKPSARRYSFEAVGRF